MWKCKECGGEIVALYSIQKRINSKKEIIGHRLSDAFIQQLECKECYCYVDNFNQIERIADWIEEEEMNKLEKINKLVEKIKYYAEGISDVYENIDIDLDDNCMEDGDIFTRLEIDKNSIRFEIAR